MEMIKINVVNGPDVWKTHTRMLIQMNVHIGPFESELTNTIDGFSDRMKTLIPSLYSHTDAAGNTSGFFKAMDKGISIAEVIEHIALELQNLAGMHTDFSTTTQTDTLGVYNVVFNCIDTDAGMYAALTSVEIAEALVKGKPYFIRHDIERLKDIYSQAKSSANHTKVTENIPYFILQKQEVKWNYGGKTA